MSRERRSDGELTRIKILEAAGQLIAEHGLAHTTNKSIASAAGVDLAAINYHFGGRDGLYLAVLSMAHQHYLDGDKLARLAASPVHPDEKLGAFIEIFISKMNEECGWYRRVLARELLAPSVQLADFVNSEGLGKIKSVRKIVSEAAGISEDDPALLPCMLSVIAPCMMLIVAGNRIPGPVSEVAAMQAQELTDHFKRFSLAGLKAIKDSKKSQ
ncbi:TetR/AcrR family transcriptional regulator [Tatumella citrea]|uniref:TetR family transcriptional regulator n=1 Tax=Tatumella citrea TaxID=53336 RepID=A0A1Y0L7L9_TATCI|nr:TetR/AcrR family transcriptional regulator [Tatumella citrea]ARU93679.1 TetR family transcriptional regulator [Tatumella citrea]ARU97717.1 TetR family transcriptional regulator [Tatumella citrea]